MRRHRIVVQIILLVFSVIGFALAAPVVVRQGIRDVRIDVAKDVTIARKRWSPSCKWRTNAADKMDMPPSSGSSDSHYRLEQELWSHYPRSPMDSNDPPQPSVGSTDLDSSHSLPVGPSSPAPAHYNLPTDIDSNVMPQPSQEPTGSDTSHPLPVGLPAPAHNNVPLDIDLNASPEPNPDPTNSDNPHLQAWPVNQPAPAHYHLPDLNASPQPSQELTDSSDSGSYSTESSTDDSHSTDSETSSDVTMSPSAWYEMSVFEYPKSESSESRLSPSPDPNLPPPRGNLGIDLNRPLSSGPAEDQPAPALPLDRGSLKRPYIPSDSDDSDPGPSRRPYRPQDPGPSTWAYPPSDPGPSTWTYPLSDPTSHPLSGPTLSLYPPSDPTSHPLSGPTLSLYPPSDPTSHPLSGPTLSLYPPSDPTSHPLSGPTLALFPPSDPAHPLSGPTLSLYPPSDPTTHPPSSLGTVKQESEFFFSELFESTGRLERRISGSRSVNPAQRELQGTLDSGEYVSASIFPFPPTFRPPLS